ncbi:O-acetylserine/cysteine exporter [Pseudomonas chengduensis]|jgi:O-acetylserine/cysteine efflux transporter|uniref:O-acetylserine/cysteine efflux transporter n=1 Tax=Pseudomonas sihuiensis TaxID=1274359 RepID=A0A1H2LX74_9PSED|nr:MULTISPECIES: O-acetylserine/cysteine exporter [Pseudomonas]ERH48019.1 membrane protein [Pseudomonas chengduensis]MDG9758132.1 O-acetylserine/cysteine exporter [Pseudomonas sediminis]MDH0958808.1 O-acetylserine/cysteine exporter [Pseudomonas chengduensis]MDH1535514.1 O-acetylserine/cysteine exporter [Pseudomonas chengduensis]MDH1560989.1 O-acetylserine/cysteine exporter [Pseudomonas chengduensis]
MTPKDLLLALLVIVVWGLNFVVIKVGLHGMPPMLMGALRFMLAAFPAILFVRRPQVPLRWMLAYGMTISVGQFAFLFYAMYVGMPAGLASLVLQSQAFFTLFFAALFLGERLRGSNLFGLLVAASGLVLIGLQGGQAMTLAGFALTIAAASMWALGNVVTRKLGKVNLVGLVVWGSLIPPLPFLALSLWLEGPELISQSLRTLGVDSLLVLAYLAFGATILGYGLWSRLLSRYPASQVAPFSLLVPVVGISSSALLLGERLGSLQMVGAALVMAGLLINVWGGRLLDSWRQRAPGPV